MIRRKSYPRYVINPAMLKPEWQGSEHGFRAFKNKSWLNSAWLGSVWNVMCLPERVWGRAISPLLRADLTGAVLGVFTTVLLTVAFFVVGIFGRLCMLPFSPEILANALVLDEDQARNSPQEQAIVRV